MKRMLLALTLLLLAGPAFAQGPVQTQQVPQRIDASSNLCTATAAISNGATCTITVPSGQWVYVTAIELSLLCGTGTCTAAVATAITTTNLGGAAFTMPSTGSGAAAGTGFTQYFPFPSPIKSATPGTNVVVGATPAITNGYWRINVWGYFSSQ